MIRRILFTTAAAAALFAAAPAFAEDKAPENQPCSCCSDGSNHDVDHRIHQAPPPKKESARSTQQEDAAIRMQSSLG
jgi:hypothetical protein